jgi:hypothetical protein
MCSQRAHQRTLKQQYLDNAPAAGVFSIRHETSGRVLLGAAANAEGALNRHRFELRRLAHRHAALQADWRADGEAAFRFEVVDTVKPRPDDPRFDAAAELQALLALWRDELQRLGTPRYALPGERPPAG